MSSLKIAFSRHTYLLLLCTKSSCVNVLTKGFRWQNYLIIFGHDSD